MSPKRPRQRLSRAAGPGGPPDGNLKRSSRPLPTALMIPPRAPGPPPPGTRSTIRTRRGSGQRMSSPTSTATRARSDQRGIRCRRNRPTACRHCRRRPSREGSWRPRRPSRLRAASLSRPGWVQDEPGYRTTRALTTEPYEQPGGLHAGQAEEQDRLRVTAATSAESPTCHATGDRTCGCRRTASTSCAATRRSSAGSVWSEIDALEVPSPRVRRRRNRDRARLVVRTYQGDATFEVPGFSGDELHERVAPLVARFGRR